MVKYSVLMPIYYKEKPEYFETAIRSVMSQTILPNEIVLVCDGPLTDELNNKIDVEYNKFDIIEPIYFDILAKIFNGSLV